MKTKEQRTADVLARYRNLPGEFYMLKGLLCLPAACGSSDSPGSNWKEARDEERQIDDLFDLMAVARRMDEINAEALAA